VRGRPASIISTATARLDQDNTAEMPADAEQQRQQADGAGQDGSDADEADSGNAANRP
jgi:hypothetical protein